MHHEAPEEELERDELERVEHPPDPEVRPERLAGDAGRRTDTSPGTRRRRKRSRRRGARSRTARRRSTPVRADAGEAQSEVAQRPVQHETDRRAPAGSRTPRSMTIAHAVSCTNWLSEATSPVPSRRAQYSDNVKQTATVTQDRARRRGRRVRDDHRASASSPHVGHVRAPDAVGTTVSVVGGAGASEGRVRVAVVDSSTRPPRSGTSRSTRRCRRRRARWCR